MHLSHNCRRRLGAMTPGRRIRRFWSPACETLEPRCLLAGDLQLAGDSFALRQNQSLEVLDVLANDEFSEDYDGAREITSVSFGTEGGTIRIHPQRDSIEYTPPADFVGTESFTYFVDGVAFQEVSVRIQSPLNPDEYEIPPDGKMHRLNVMANDPFWKDYEGAKRITLASVSSAGSGVAISEDGQSILYTPTDDRFGFDEFIYIVDEIYPTRVRITVPQTIASDEFEMVQNTEGTYLNVLANDPFWPGYAGDGRITSVSTSSRESVVEIVDDGSGLRYTPPTDFSGWDSFHYVVDDRFEGFVSIVVHRPVVNDSFEIDRNSTDHLFDVLTNDRYRSRHGGYRDVVDIVTEVTQPESGGVVEILAGGRSISYTPPTDYSGLDQFTYTADGKHQASVTVNVTRPVRPDYLTAYQDTPGYRLPVTENDFYGNGYQGARQITSFSQTEQNAILSILGGSIAYTPADGFTGSDSFTYTIDDDLQAEVHVNVRPLAQPDHYSFCADPTHGAYVLSVLSNDHFDLGYTGPAVITAVETPDGVSVAVSEDGSHLLYQPSSVGFDSFTYTIDGKYTATASVSIRGHLSYDFAVTDQNSDSISIDVLSNDFRRDGRYDQCKSVFYRGERVITDVSAQSEHGGTVTLGPDGRTVNYQPPVDYVGADSFTYEVDGIMQSSVTVNVIRRVRDDLYRIAPGESQALAVRVNDLFGDYQGAQKITDVTASELGAQVQIAEDGESILYVAPAGTSGTDRLTYTIDGDLKAEVQVEVRAEGTTLFPRFESLAEYEQFLLDDALQRYEHLFGQQQWHWRLDDGAAFEGGPRGPEPTNADVERDHSETNVQVAGVDEGDIVEFDSDYVYMLTGNDLVILDAWPAEDLAEVSRRTIEGTPIAEFLKDDRLTVISEIVQYNYWFDQGFIDGVPFNRGVDFASDFGPPIWGPPEATTIVTVFDVSDRTDPAVVQTTKMEGRYIESRGVGDFVYLVLSNEAVAPTPSVIFDPPEEGAEDEVRSGRYETREQYIERFSAETGQFVEEALPNYFSFDGAGEMARSGLIHEPEDIFKRLQSDASSLLSLVSMDVTNSEPGLAGSSGVYTVGAANVYASLDHFYVFENSYDREDGAGTRILKFNWDGDSGEAEFAAQGYVAGQMLNQFSADEYDGHLRIATTIRNSGSGNFTGRSENDLFVLRDDAGVMEFVGSLQNLAIDETIRSVRFMGPRTFVVTFREVDPLFGLDVSDHANPASLGHLTLPGFSSYMQLIDENHLLAVGRNTPTGGFGPAQVTLFDVTDLTRPRMVDEFTFERFSTTEAAVDHHAFGYFARHGLFAVPVSQQYIQRVDKDGDGYRETREWFVEHELSVFRIDVNATPGTDQGIVPVSQIEHDTIVRRSGYVGDKLYSIAQNSVKVVDVATPDVVIATADDLHRIVEEVPPPIPLALDEGARQAIDTAREHLANKLAIDAGDAFAVTAEPSGASWQLVFRVNDRHYLYEAQGSEVVLADDDFTFGEADEPISWQNLNNALDVNNDGEVAPNDAILIINELADRGAHDLPTHSVLRQIDDEYTVYLDTSGDGVLSNLDALLVINRLNEQARTNIPIDDVDLDDVPSVDPSTIDRVFLDTRRRAGDSNLDGQFDSSDLVRVFRAGEYEDSIARNSSWADGDWNGDLEFTTEDIVLAFMFGNYERGAEAADLDIDLP